MPVWLCKANAVAIWAGRAVFRAAAQAVFRAAAQAASEEAGRAVFRVAVRVASEEAGRVVFRVVVRAASEEAGRAAFRVAGRAVSAGIPRGDPEANTSPDKADTICTSAQTAKAEAEDSNKALYHLLHHSMQPVGLWSRAYAPNNVLHKAAQI